MKNICSILLIFLVSTLSVPVFGQKLKGKVLSYSDSYYSMHEIFGRIKKGAKLNDSLYHDQVVYFDQHGNVSQAIDFNADGTVYCNYKGMKGPADNNFESIFVRFDKEIRVDRKPFVIDLVHYPSGEICGMTYKNDEQGRPMDETIVDLMGRTLYVIEFKRDEYGNPTEEKFSDGTTNQFTYDDEGHRLDWISHTSRGNTIMTSFKHDSFGNPIEENINDFFKSSYKYHYEHNTYKYKYDKQDNWIERTDYEHDIPQRIVVRTIEYAR